MSLPYNSEIIFPDDFGDEDTLKTALFRAMETEIGSLKYTMTSKRRALSHRFILDCYRELLEGSRKIPNQEISQHSIR